MKTLGRMTALTIRDVTQNKLRFTIMVLAIWFGVVSNVNIPDSTAQDFFMTSFLLGTLALIFGAITFRTFLVMRGAFKIGKQLTYSRK